MAKNAVRIDELCAGLASRAFMAYFFAVSTTDLIAKEVINLPEPLQREVYDFVRFLRLKRDDASFNGLLLSETALAKDWNTPEEDAAWASL
jgi:hypothetical protein